MIFKQTFSWNLGLILLGTFTCFLVGCESNNRKYQSMIDLPGFELTYNGNVKLESIPLKSDDKDEIIGLYQEVGDEIGYRDSLLIAKKYSRGMGINAFVQDNLDVLNTQGLTLSNLSKTQIRIEKYGEKINAVLVEYEVTEGFIEEVPILHFVQLFIPDGENIILLSFITENESSANSASNMFTNIK